MATSLNALQGQVNDILKMAPSLAPMVVPRGHDYQTLSAMAAADGAAPAVERLRSVLDGHASGVSHCGICESQGQAKVGGAEDEGGDGSELLDELRFTTLWNVDFPGKKLHLTRGMFACGRCRCCLDVNAWVRYGALSMLPADEGEEGMAAPLVEELVAHMVFANKKMRDAGGKALQGDAAAWAQELVARAYALRVVSSNIRKWAVVVGPEGRPLPPRSAGRAADLASALLGAGAGRKNKTPGKGKGTKSPGGAATPGKTQGKTPSKAGRAEGVTPGKTPSKAGRVGEVA
eukprot:CAMPEP_0182872282 /NCGR_PEP_ID=MMETSP0034_2-20130328/11609_1 /TAXON_ID=156128 /ORGANISM="Nephroselmis pyriformis, Strain CCMP717" /LENGTH=289 /DNA_ID=CAMNT_0025004865 /DNA_START=170 /DNA_END=1036 /DNA_ORIENTATION=+